MYVSIFECLCIHAGELNAEELVLDDREKHFILWEHMKIASQLTKYSTTNNSIDSIILGKVLHLMMQYVSSNVIASDCLHKEATDIVAKSTANSTNLLELERRLLIVDDSTRQVCLQAGRSLAVKRRIVQLQADMEMHFLSINKRLVAIQNCAST